MRIHHLNCGTDCPVGGALFDGRSKGLTGRLVCHCLLVETDAHGIVLIDTGYGLRDVACPHRKPHPRITRAMRTMLNIRLREEETALRQIERARLLGGGRSPYRADPSRLRPCRRARGLSRRHHPPDGRGILGRERAPARLRSVQPLPAVAMGRYRRLAALQRPGRALVRLRGGARPRRPAARNPDDRRFPATPGVMPESPSPTAAAGCSTPATPISTATRCGSRGGAARPAFAPIRR